MKDEDYDKLEVTPCDVKAIQNSSNGVSDFWLKAMLNHPIAALITEKDRPILGYLTNISLQLHEEELGEGYTLFFTFDKNSYFEGTELKKEFHMKHKGILDKTVSTQLKWKDGCDPTRTKKKKKVKGKKVNVEVKCESFFNFFSDDNDEAPKE